MAQKVINTAIVGFGLSGKVFHAPFIHVHNGFSIKKIVERHKQESKDIYPYIDIIKDYKDILNDPDIDLAVICTPNTLHYQMVKETLLAGKHVVIEKPFTPTSNEADELIELAKSKNLKIFVYHNRRWDGDFLTIQKLIKSGVLGNLQEYEAHFDRYKPELTKNVWRDEPISGGGILYDLGSHLIDQALVLFGKPNAIKADIQSQRKGSKVDDYFELHLLYDKLKVILKAGMLVKETEPRFILHGLLGSFIKYGIDPQEEELRQGQFPTGENWGIESPDTWGIVTIDYQDMNIHGNIETEAGCYQEFYNNVYDVLRNGAEMAVKPHEARNVIKMIELAFKSSKNKTEEEVDF